MKIALGHWVCQGCIQKDNQLLSSTCQKNMCNLDHEQCSLWIQNTSCVPEWLGIVAHYDCCSLRGGCWNHPRALLDQKIQGHRLQMTSHSYSPWILQNSDLSWGGRSIQCWLSLCQKRKALRHTIHLRRYNWRYSERFLPNDAYSTTSPDQVRVFVQSIVGAAKTLIGRMNVL